jgi:hypothetical protein
LDIYSLLGRPRFLGVSQHALLMPGAQPDTLFAAWIRQGSILETLERSDQTFGEGRIGPVFVSAPITYLK